MGRGDSRDAKHNIPQEFYTSQAKIIEDEELKAQTFLVIELKGALEYLKTQFDLSASGGSAFSFTEDGRKAVMEWVEIVRERIKTADISHILAQKIESYLKEVEKYAKKIPAAKQGLSPLFLPNFLRKKSGARLSPLPPKWIILSTASGWNG